MKEEENVNLIEKLINNKNQILDEYYQEYRSELKNNNFLKILDEVLPHIKLDINGHPDYLAFDQAMIKIEDKYRNQGDYHLISGNFQDDAAPNIYYVLFLRFVKAIYELNQEKDDYLLEFKVLYHYFNNIRFNNILSIFINGLRDYAVADLTYDIDTLDQSVKKERFLMAIKRQEKETAFELLAAMDDISEKNYFKGLLYYRDGNYEKANKYLNHPSITNNSTDIIAINNLKLLCAAYLSDNKTIKKLLKTYKKIPKYLYLYVKLIYLLNTSLTKADNIFPKGKVKFMESSDYHYEFASLVMDTLTKIYLQIEEYEMAKTISDDFPTLTEEEYFQKVLGEYNFQALSFILSLFEEEDNFIQNMRKIINCHSLTDLEWLQNYFRDIAYAVILPYAHLNLNWLLAYAHFLYKIGQRDQFRQFCLEGLDILIKMGENNPYSEAGGILELLYEVTMELNKPNKKLNQFIKKQQVKNYDIKVNQALNNLSLKAQSSLKVAEWLYQKSQEEDYGWKDASFISLAFYLNIEKEFNYYLMQIFKNTTSRELRKVYEAEFNSLEKEEAQKYSQKWDYLVNVLDDLEQEFHHKETKKTRHFMLGNIHALLLLLEKQNCQIAQFIKENLDKALASEFVDIKKIYEIMLKYTADGMINKYRNPPAHGRYLTYDVACECRQLVLNLFSEEIANLKIKNTCYNK